MTAWKMDDGLGSTLDAELMSELLVASSRGAPTGTQCKARATLSEGFRWGPQIALDTLGAPNA